MWKVAVLGKKIRVIKTKKGLQKFIKARKGYRFYSYTLTRTISKKQLLKYPHQFFAVIPMMRQTEIYR